MHRYAECTCVLWNAHAWFQKVNARFWNLNRMYLSIGTEEKGGQNLIMALPKLHLQDTLHPDSYLEYTQ